LQNLNNSTDSELMKFWDYFTSKLRSQLTSVSYSTWVESANPTKIEGNNIFITVPTKLHKDYWERNYTEKIAIYSFELNGIELNPVIQNDEDDNSIEEQTLTPRAKSPEETAQPKQVFHNSHLNPKYTFSFVLTFSFSRV